MGGNMNQLNLKYMDECEFENILPQIFAILYANMSIIAPTGNSYESDFQIWKSHILPALYTKNRKTILLYVNSELVGYFRYYLNGNTQSLLLEDVQIKSEFQGMGMFSSCLKWLRNQLPDDIFNIEAYVDKRNNRSRAIAEHLGLVYNGENKNGISLCFKGDYLALFSKKE